MTYTVTIYTLTSAATTGSTGVDKSGDQGGLKQLFHLPKTGDTAQIALWAVVFVASAGIFICLFILKKRKNDGKNEQYESE